MADTKNDVLGDVPMTGIVAVTPHDTNALTDGTCRALWIGVAGTITIVDADGNTAGAITVPVGLFPVQCNIVKATGTTSTEIWAIY